MQHNFKDKYSHIYIVKTTYYVFKFSNQALNRAHVKGGS